MRRRAEEELRALIKRCCDIAEASDKVAMRAMRLAETLRKSVGDHRRDAMSRFRELSQRVGDLEREHLQRRGQ